MHTAVVLFVLAPFPPAGVMYSYSFRRVLFHTGSFPDEVSLSFPPPLPLQLPQSINTSVTEQ
jgi:hypothetical protein